MTTQIIKIEIDTSEALNALAELRAAAERANVALNNISIKATTTKPSNSATSGLSSADRQTLENDVKADFIRSSKAINSLSAAISDLNGKLSNN